MKSKDDLKEMFAYVDDFVDKKIAKVQAVVSQLSPHTLTLLDECGTTGPMFGPSPLDDPTYWVASGAYAAYFWSRAAAEHGKVVKVVSQSQFMDSPDREPGVTMMDWRTGNGTAKYWVTHLLIESFAAGEDEFRETVVTKEGAADVHAQAFARVEVGKKEYRQVLLINKSNSQATVSIPGAAGEARVVDEQSNQSAPRIIRLGSGGTLTLGAYATAVVVLVA